jgi:hypothetical protein
VGVFEKFKYSAWSFYFQKEVEKLSRERKAYNLSDAKKIGVLYDASEEAIYKKVSDFVSYLQNQKKLVKALGYLNQKMTPHYCMPKLAYDFYSVKDLNWYYKPNNNFVKDFIEEEFDIVIDLNLNENLSSKYISGVSKAKFKVGIYDERNSDYYDMMIKVEDKNNLNEFIKQILHYLNILNSRKNAS